MYGLLDSPYFFYKKNEFVFAIKNKMFHIHC